MALAALADEVRRLRAENTTFRNAMKACEACGPNTPRWEHGEPANLEAAAEDALEWLNWILAIRGRLSVPYLGAEQAQKLRRCMAALATFARPVSSGVAP